MFDLKFGPVFLGVVGAIIAAVSCILPASSGKWVDNVGKQKTSLMSMGEQCKVRGMRWPSDKTPSTHQFLWKRSIQEDPKCRGEPSSCWNKYD